ncbi:hypothetical protein D3C76_1041930 [compost metagenome]
MMPRRQGCDKNAEHLMHRAWSRNLHDSEQARLCNSLFFKGVIFCHNWHSRCNGYCANGLVANHLRRKHHDHPCRLPRCRFSKPLRCFLGGDLRWRRYRSCLVSDPGGPWCRAWLRSHFPLGRRGGQCKSLGHLHHRMAAADADHRFGAGRLHCRPAAGEMGQPAWR